MCPLVLYILLGLRYLPDLAAQLFREMVSMKESSTYRAILQEGLQRGLQEGLRMGLAEGAVVEARKLLRLWGERHFGPAETQTLTTIEGIDDLARLEDLCTRLPATGSWRELLELPAARSRAGRRQRSP